MRLPNNLILAVLLALAPSARAAESDEDALGKLFRLHANAPTGVSPFSATAAPIVAAMPPGPFRAAAQALQGWHLLKDGRASEAAAVYQALLDDPASSAAGAEIARRWLTRFDREQVRAALQAAWSRDLHYPDSLAVLPEPRPPLQDRWGRPWRYRTLVLKRLQLKAQGYELQSDSLGADSDLAAALARPFPTGPAIRAVSVNANAGASPVVSFENDKTPPEKALLVAGKSWMGLSLIAVGTRALLVAEGDYAFLIPKPGT